MKKFFTLIAALIFSVSMFAQEDEPNYTKKGETRSYLEGYCPKSIFPSLRDITVESYTGYVVLKKFSGVEGYDLKAEYNNDGTVTRLVTITDGVEDTEGALEWNGTVNDFAYGYLYTKREDFPKMYVYLGRSEEDGDIYDYIRVENSKETGLLYMDAYIYNNNKYSLNYYFASWPQSTELESMGDLLTAENNQFVKVPFTDLKVTYSMFDSDLWEGQGFCETASNGFIFQYTCDGYEIAELTKGKKISGEFIGYVDRMDLVSPPALMICDYNITSCEDIDVREGKLITSPEELKNPKNINKLVTVINAGQTAFAYDEYDQMFIFYKYIRNGLVRSIRGLSRLV